MGKSQRDKGAREERALVNVLKAQGLVAKRVPLSGACAGFKGDVIVELPDLDLPSLQIECKLRADGFKQIYKWIEGSDVLTLRRDGGIRLFTLRESLFLSLLQKAIYSADH